jgi:type VI secretion system protein VasD
MVAGIAVIFLASCAGQPVHEDTVRLSVEASATLNLDACGHPTPVVLRLYELAQRDRFERATFFELYDHESAALAATVLSRRVVVLHPGETWRASLTLLPQTRAIGVMAAYEKISEATWRSAVDVSPSTTRTLTVTADTNVIAAQAETVDAPAPDTVWTKVTKRWNTLTQLPRHGS